MTKSRSIIIFLLVSVSFIFSSCTHKRSNSEKWSDSEAMIKATEWQEAHPIFALAPTDWTCGAYYTGVTKAYQTTKDPLLLAAIKNMGFKNNWQPSYRVHHADDIAISYAYLFASTTRKNLVDLEPTKAWIDKHLYETNEWSDGTHSDPSKRILWWWCDALFMAPPTITYYAKLSGDESYLDSMHKHYMETYNNLFDQEEQLFARDARYIWTGSDKDLKEENGKKIFWSRGNGWVIGGLALILENMPQDYKHRKFYVTLFKTMAKRIKDIQPEDGLWRVSLLYPEKYNHGEVSGSGFFTFALAWGINNGILSKEEYGPVVFKAWNELRKCQHEDGMIGWVQNIGDSPKPASANSWQNYGTGSFLLAGSEIIKLKN